MAEIFLTGGTGFIGKRLLPKLAKGNKIFLLVRKQSLTKAKERIKKEKLRNIQIVIGDLEQENLGLSQKEAGRIFKNIDYIYHLAASYNPSYTREKLFRIILEGTREIVSLLRGAEKLKAFVHVSTAHVAGFREGRIFENQLVRPKTFHNFYEEAKFESEVFLRRTNLPLMVIRPAVVVGNSKTGEFDEGVRSGFYRLLGAIEKGLIFFYPGRSQGPISAVPVDWVVEAIFKIGQNQKAIGKTFHLADSEPTTAREFIDRVCQLLGKRKPIFEMPRIIFSFLPIGRLKMQILMLNQRQIFDTTNTLELVGKENIAPPLQSYLAVLVNYFRLRERSIFRP